MPGVVRSVGGDENLDRERETGDSSIKNRDLQTLRFLAEEAMLMLGEDTESVPSIVSSQKEEDLGKKISAVNDLLRTLISLLMPKLLGWLSVEIVGQAWPNLPWLRARSEKESDAHAGGFFCHHNLHF